MLSETRPTTVNAFNSPTESSEIQDIPTGFVATRIINELQFPTDLEFLPNGDLFILEKGVMGETAEDLELAALKL